MKSNVIFTISSVACAALVLSACGGSDQIFLPLPAVNTSVPTTAPTDTPVPTTAPTDTPVPTTAPTDTPVPTAAPTDTPVPTPVVVQNACLPSVPKAGDSVKLLYKLKGDTSKWLTGKEEPTGTTYPNNYVVASDSFAPEVMVTADFVAGSDGSNVNMTANSNQQQIWNADPASAVIDAQTGAYTSVTAPVLTEGQGIITFNPQDWYKEVINQKLNVGDQIKPITTTKMLAVGQVPTLLNKLYGTKENNYKVTGPDTAIVVTMTITGERLANETVTLGNGSTVTDVCKFRYEMKKTSHTITGTGAEEMKANAKAPFEGDFIGQFMPEIKGEFWSTFAVPHFAVKSSYEHTAGIGLTGTDPLKVNLTVPTTTEEFVVNEFVKN